MAESTAVLTVTNTWSDGKRQHVVGTIAIGATPLTYATGGIAMSLADPKIKSSRSPILIQIKGLSHIDVYR